MKWIPSPKQFKYILIALTALIFISTLVYTNYLVKEVAKHEKEKAELWVKTIEKKSELVLKVDSLFQFIQKEEIKKGELWAKATKTLAQIEVGEGNFSFIFEVIRDNKTVPVILTNSQDSIISHRNLGLKNENDKSAILGALKKMKETAPPIVISLTGGKKNFLYYGESKILTRIQTLFQDLFQSFINDIEGNSISVPVIYTDSTFSKIIASGNLTEEGKLDSAAMKKKLLDMKKNANVKKMGKSHYLLYEESTLLYYLKFFPYIQISAILALISGAYVFFKTTKNAEQNQLWVGMSKETAHQLGTPISSMMAWLELLKMKYEDDDTLQEFEKDISRLQLITDRFSKIGSIPDLQPYPVVQMVEESKDYLQKRLSSNVRFILSYDPEAKDSVVRVSVPLMSWVIENLTKNGVDAMSGKGTITYHISKQNGKVVLEVSDTGKGITRKNQKKVFQAGFTTKARGWGLGLALTKRIVENYHNGKIFIKHSEAGKGTTFKIVFPENQED